MAKLPYIPPAKAKPGNANSWHITRSELTDGDVSLEMLHVPFSQHPKFEPYFTSLVFQIAGCKTPTYYDRTKASRITYFNNFVYQMMQDYDGLDEIHKWLYAMTPAFCRALQFFSNTTIRAENVDTLISIIEALKPIIGDMTCQQVRVYELCIDDFLNDEFLKRFGKSNYAQMRKVFYLENSTMLKPLSNRPKV